MSKKNRNRRGGERISATRKWKTRSHETLVRRILQEPEDLSWGMIASGTVLYREKGPELLEKGRETVDILFLVLTKKESPYGRVLVISPIEVKIGTAPDRLEKADEQLSIARRFFVRNWDDWLEKKGIMPEGIKVWLNLILVYAGGNVEIGEMDLDIEELELGEF